MSGFRPLSSIYMVGVGEEDMSSLKVAVMVTIPLFTNRSLSEQLKVTVGAMVSISKVMLSFPL